MGFWLVLLSTISTGDHLLYISYMHSIYAYAALVKGYFLYGAKNSGAAYAAPERVVVLLLVAEIGTIGLSQAFRPV